MTRLRSATTLLTLALAAWPLAGQSPDDPSAVFLGTATGTARQPASTAMEHPMSRVGPWYVMAHGFGTFGVRADGGLRGRDELFTTSMGMVSARRALGAGWLELRAMASAEPVMGRRGYPLLLQTGETADGISPLVDRQHPHDLLMEISASVRMEVDRDAWAFLYLAPIGEPASGPVPFMHRASSGGGPLAPITHHFLDATHISYGVATLGLVVDRRVQIEISAFNGHEPDEDRWVPDAPGLNSYAARVTVMPGPDWAFQGSFADLAEPEQLHPVIDVYRMTLSAMHERRVGSARWSSTAAFGRNIRQEATMPLGEARERLSGPLLDHYLNVGSLPPNADDDLRILFERRVQSAFLVESAIRWSRTVAYGRYEWARKDELFPPPDIRHGDFFAVGKASLGLIRRLASVGSVGMGLGAEVGVYFVPTDLGSGYGEGLTGFTTFVRVAL